MLRTTTTQTQLVAGVFRPATGKASLALSSHLLGSPQLSGSYPKRQMSAGPQWQTMVVAVCHRATMIDVCAVFVIWYCRWCANGLGCVRADQYALCPASAEITEECFHKIPLHFASEMQTLRYIYVNDTSNRTEVQIPATRINTGTVTRGSTCAYSVQVVP